MHDSPAHRPDGHEQNGARTCGLGFAGEGDLSWAANAVQEQRDTILQRWLDATRALPVHQGRLEDAVSDHIPQMVDALGSLLRRGAPRGTTPCDPMGDPAVHEAARAHARTRVEQGLCTAEIATEFRLLHLEICRALMQHVPNDAPARDVLAGALVMQDSMDGAVMLALLAHRQHDDERRLTADALHASEAQLQAIVQSAMDPIITIGDDQRIRLFNAAAELLFGYRAEDVLNQPLDMLLPERFREDHRQHVRRFVSTGVTTRAMGHQMPLTALRADGSEVPIEAAISQVEAGGRRLLTVIIRDISERRQAEADREALLAAIAHDLKNPLTAIRAATQVLQRMVGQGEISREKLIERLGTIDDSVQRAVMRLGEILDVTRAEQPLLLRRDSVDLVALVHSAVATHQIGAERHMFVVDAREARLTGDWDRGRIERVLDNLLSNAVKYSPAGGEVRVQVRRQQDGDGHWAVLRVSDQGIGIPEADIARVFDSYQRGANVATIPGSGIGLAAVKRIAQEHGGRVGVESVVGAGTTFTVMLPLRD